MPCNTANQLPDCDCSSGGVFHGDANVWVEANWSRAVSHCYGDAQCPRRGQAFFFYRSPYRRTVLIVKALLAETA